MTFRSSCSQRFFKISVLKNLQACNFIKKRFQYRCFPVNIAKSFKNILFLENTAGGCFSTFPKIIFENFRFHHCFELSSRWFCLLISNPLRKGISSLCMPSDTYFQKQPQSCSIKQVVLKNLTKFSVKPLSQSLIFKARTQMLSCKFCDIFQNTYFYRIPLVAQLQVRRWLHIILNIFC